MREVNFSIPAANKASVGITTALYDRRALDCTSTLPLINSLNHLAYLTTSSARIREILTIDGGIERLVCILKDGRSKDVNEAWKWSLALQCVVNIGVRGSENVRTRVVEADVVPVIATILDNYMQVSEKLRAKEESAGGKRESSRHKRVYRPDESAGSGSASRTDRRRPEPPPIQIPQDDHSHTLADAPAAEASTLRVPADTQPMVLSSPVEPSTSSRQQTYRHRHNQSQGEPVASSVESRRRSHTEPSEPHPYLTISTRVSEAPEDESMFTENQEAILSRPESPRTPTAIFPPAESGTQMEESPEQLRRHPSIRQEVSIAGDSDDGQNDGLPNIGEIDDEVRLEPIVGIQNGMDDQEMVDRAALIDAVESQDRITTPNVNETTDGDFNMTDRSMEGAIINAVAGTPNITAGLATQLNVSDPIPQPTPTPWANRFSQDRTLAVGPLSSLPRDDDCIWALQLLAYVSKYCNLRTYFQQSHLVPKLKIGREVRLVDGEIFIDPIENATNEEEYLQPDDYNIFPLVEKFTVRHHCDEMKYWAGVVMRNLCRKDRSRKGIRQCAYYKCGKWEDYPRQFAKCRRCRQTKYCSKECQKSAWVYHRHWCQTAST